MLAFSTTAEYFALIGERHHVQLLLLSHLKNDSHAWENAEDPTLLMMVPRNTRSTSKELIVLM